VGEALFWGAAGSSSLLTFFVGDSVMTAGAAPTASAREAARRAARRSRSSSGRCSTGLADTMMPEAFDHGGRYVGLATTAGFGLAFGISELE
jgi:ZIP family zinc transporter